MCGMFCKNFMKSLFVFVGDKLLIESFSLTGMAFVKVFKDLYVCVKITADKMGV